MQTMRTQEFVSAWPRVSTAGAARREVLDENGLYDACIVGGGDLAMISAAYGCFDIAWAPSCYEMCHNETGFLDRPLFHLWHGEMDTRRYRKRHDGLRRFDFNPFQD